MSAAPTVAPTEFAERQPSMNDVFIELKKVFESTTYQKKMTDDILRCKGYTLEYNSLSKVYYWINKRFKASHSYLETCFGRYEYDRFVCMPYRYTNNRGFGYGKCGIEILGLRPYATGTTFSNLCVTTIPELKGFCKRNGIQFKSTWKKINYLSALMKV
jgi:hypothetical protein